MTAASDDQIVERRYDLNPTFSNRTRNCTLCGGRNVREHRRIGTPDDPDYAVAVCPTCDLPALVDRIEAKP